MGWLSYVRLRRGGRPSLNGRSVATTADGSPGWLAEFVLRLGGMTVLGARAIVALAQPPFPWWREFVLQCVFILKVSLLPIAVSIALWGFSGPGLQAGNFLVTFGTIDRSGGFMVVAIVREFGTFVTATVVAGVVGTTITAELGARKIRDELDALRVMGVDVIKFMVAPRILALVVMMMVLDMFALVFGVFGGYVAAVGVLGGTTGAFFTNFFANTTFVDLFASVVKVALFGLLIGVICCYKGLNVSGGPEGVGRAVNEAVVGCLVAIFLVNLVYTQYFLAAFPQVGVFR
ncbi:MAG TPA: ABC transporter permease [Solirubrobacteraceae bacterium]|nr:ABC transporter permease [Solirubrobacteraceae bacterium]